LLELIQNIIHFDLHEITVFLPFSSFSVLVFWVSRGMNLINFNHYQDYVDSFITIQDTRYLGNKEIQRNLIQNACGKNCLGNLLTREQFYQRKEKELVLLKPRGLRGLQLFGDYLNNKDEVLQQFANREKKLLEKQISVTFMCSEMCTFCNF